MRGAIFGDVGGHRNQFFAALSALGVNLATGEVPDDLHVISVGDLVHRGPDSDDIVNFVDKALDINPDRWTQLIGNHEAMHVGLSVPFWNCSCSARTDALLKKWHSNDTARLATAFSGTAAKRLVLPETVVTHAGLTRLLWLKLGGSPDAGVVAQQINDAAINDTCRPGNMLNGGRNRFNAGVFWAAASTEVYPSWDDEEMPFNQVHGHTAPFSWGFQSWYPATPLKYRKVMNAYPFDRASVLRTENGGSFVGVDPAFGKVETIPSQPYLNVEDFVLLH